MCSRSGVPAVLAVALAVAGLLASGCGRQGDPAPPLRFIPAPTKDLTVAQQGRELVLGMSYPSATEAGMPLPQLRRIEIWEMTRELPPLESLKEGDPRPAALRRPEPPEFAGQAQLVATLSGDDLSRSVVGERLVFRHPLPVDAPPRLHIHFYAVRAAVSERDVSETSNIVGLVPRYPPPEPPESFELVQKAEGLEVVWEPVSLPETQELAGYRVYRRDPQSRFWGDPRGATEAGTTRFLDRTARFDTSYIYAVTTVIQHNPLIESAPGAAQEVTYHDTFPPAPPREPVGLVEEGRIRLVWQASPAEDLAGYHVYRRTLGRTGDKIHEGQLTRTEHVDEDVEPGRTYLYRITAVDQRGNEGPPSDEVRLEAR